MRFAIILTLASLLPAPERAPEPPPARWPDTTSAFPYVKGNNCIIIKGSLELSSASYQAWRYDRRRNPVCVQSI